MGELISDPHDRAAAERGEELPPEPAADAEKADYRWYADPEDDLDDDEPGWAIWGGRAPETIVP